MRLHRTIVARLACLVPLVAASGCALVLGLERGELSDADASVGATDAGADDPLPARYAAAVLADGPLAYYPFTEPPGAARVANRAPPPLGTSARERDGEVAGATLGVEGALGAADRAVGGARVDLRWGGLPSGNEPFAIEALVRGREGTVVACRDEATADFTGYRLYLANGDAAFERVAADGTRATVRALGVARADVWTHLVATFDGARMRLVVDGTVADEIRTTVRVPGGGRALTVGTERAGAAPFAGSVDELALYGKELAPENIGGHVRSLAP